MTLYEQWRKALDGVNFKHPDREAIPVFELIPGKHPTLNVRVLNCRCTVTDERMAALAISTVELCCFPGETIARQWLAAAWTSYLMHESLELVTLKDGGPPLDPHAQPYVTNPINRCLRDGLPVKLTPETLHSTFLTIMDERAIGELGLHYAG